MREKILLNNGWKICFTEQQEAVAVNKGGAYKSAKTERAQWGYASDSYDETAWGNFDNWKDVTLPNDYIITQTPDKTKNDAWGYFNYHSACYKKRFILDEEDRKKRITLYFEGIATTCVIYVNSCLMARNYSAYTPIEIDISDVANYGAENTVCIFVDASPTEGWWYGGGGIYRDVWLCKANFVSIDLYGVFVNPQKIRESEWDVAIETTVRNDGVCSQNLTIVSEILYKGKSVGRTEGAILLSGKAKGTVNTNIYITNPELWDIENPCLYTLNTRIYLYGTEVDKTDVNFGFRTVEFHKDKGFFLNGRHVRLKGTNRQSDFWGIGDAWPNNLIEWELKGLKDMGCNIIRTSHYVMDREVYKVCDEIGLLVFNEFCLRSLRGTALTDLPAAKAMARDIWKDVIEQLYNHPSIIIWSYFNEAISQVQPEMAVAVVEIAKDVNEYIHSLDNTRKTAIATFPIDDYGFFRVADICAPTGGANCDAGHSRHPEIVYMWSEFTTMIRSEEHTSELQSQPKK